MLQHCTYRIISSLLLRPHTDLSAHTAHQDQIALNLFFDPILPRLPRKQETPMQINIKHLPPPVISILLGRYIIHNTGRRKHDINLPKIRENQGPRVPDLRLGRNVACVGAQLWRIPFGSGSGGGCSNALADLSDGCLAGWERQVDAGASGPGEGECSEEFSSETAGGARDEACFAFEGE